MSIFTFRPRYTRPSTIRTLVIASSAVATGIATGTGAAYAQSSVKTPPKAKISTKQAEAAAVKNIGGKLISSKYEFEDGRWQYAVLVNDKKGRLYEVEVNATTGKVMDAEKTSAKSEAREEASDKKAAAGKSKPE